MITPQSLLTVGLQKGFVGETDFKPAKRAGFDLLTSQLDLDGNVYRDEWAGERAGGGQELVQVKGSTYTRVYAGGMLSQAALTQLGISKKDILAYLIKCLNQYGEATRLSAECGPHQDGDWSYHYQVLEQNETIPMTTGKEDISYQGNVVFTHVFVMCPVE